MDRSLPTPGLANVALCLVSNYAGSDQGRIRMPRPPNYSQERLDRDKAKAKKKAEKLAIKTEAREQNKTIVDSDLGKAPRTDD